MGKSPEITKKEYISDSCTEINQQMQSVRKFQARDTYYLGGEPFITGGRTYHEAVKWVFHKGESKAHPTGYVIDDSETVWEIGTPEFNRMFIEV